MAADTLAVLVLVGSLTVPNVLEAPEWLRIALPFSLMLILSLPELIGNGTQWTDN